MIGTTLLDRHEKGFWMADFFNVPPGEWENSEELWPPDGYLTRPTREECIQAARQAHLDYQIYEMDGACECYDEEEDCEDPECGMYWTKLVEELVH